MANQDPEDVRKPHRPRQAGRKAEKKTKKKVNLTGEKQPNPKAFAFNSAVRAERRFRRKQDIETKKQHIPLVDRTPVETPPVVVAIVGPPKVGKTTLIQNLIKNFTRQPLTSLKGPVTIVSGKKRRLTLIECNNDINCMIDIAKIADLVLLLVDASFGFEMEIFEFLNICQVHGMPRIMGVLTHLDMLKSSKQLKHVKKTLKHRFWTEVYDGAKLFYLSGLIHGEYLRNEIKNLGRFISIMKFRPLVWRTSHPYVFVDRFEDITSPEAVRQNPVVDREICFYGFVRGIPLNKSYSIHIPGCGDFKMKDVSYLPDPCPLPEKEKRRSLIEKEKLIYAPFSGVGGIVYDKDAVYVELAGSHSHSQERNTSEFVSSLLDVQEPLDKKMAHSELQLFSGAEPITNADVIRKFDHPYESVMESGRERKKVIFNDDLEEELGGSHADGHNPDSDEESEVYTDDGEIEKKNVESDGTEYEAEDAYSQNKINSKYIWEDTEDIQESENPSRNGLASPRHEVSGTVTTKRKCESNIDSDISPKVKKKSNLSSANMKLMKEMGDSCDEISDDEHHNTIAEKDHKNEITSDGNSRIHQKQNLAVTSKISECLAQLKKNSVKDNEKVCWDKNVSYSENEEKNKDTIFNEFGKMNHNIASDDCSSNSDENKVFEASTVQWKSNLAERASNAFFDRQANSFTLWKLVYGQADKRVDSSDKKEVQNDEDEYLGGLFQKLNKEQKRLQEERDLQDQKDCSKARMVRCKDWSKSITFDSIRDCFVTGKWKESENAEELLKMDDASISGESEIYGDFEDVETGEKYTAKNEDEKPAKEVGSKSKILPMDKKELIEKKKKLKAKFDAEYDEGEGDFSYYQELKLEVNRQSELNKNEFEGMDEDLRVQLEGFRPGMYVRIEISNVPYEFVTNFDATYPIIMGGLLTGEENVGYVQVRLKKHRWYNRILKNCDPLILSLGWRRFQTIPVFAKLEDNLRHRMLKYTPEHVACMGHFWGPITPQGTGFLAVQTIANKELGFRIAATGAVVELDKSVQVMKKLQLTGVPIKVYKKSAFIRDMFNSALEVAKFEGAKLKTVSGIRGQIKRAVGKPEGSFRATFEDKIKFSDIVFCRTWYKVGIPRLYNPVLSLLLPADKKNAWQGMKTVGQLKREKGIRSEPLKDSLYKPIEREPKVVTPLVIPAKLQKMLPYKDKPKKPVLVSAKQQIEKKRIAVVRDTHEQKVSHLMKRLQTTYEAKQKQDKAIIVKKKEERKRVLEKEEIKQLKRQKELRKQVFRTLDKLDQKKKASALAHGKKKMK